MLFSKEIGFVPVQAVYTTVDIDLCFGLHDSIYSRHLGTEIDYQSMLLLILFKLKYFRTLKVGYYFFHQNMAFINNKTHKSV